MSSMDGKTAIVTGSSSGIGRAVAEAFAADGANVVTNARALERAEATAEAIRDAGGSAVAAEADVTDPDSVEAMVDAAVDAFGRVDVMVNNAGINRRGPAEELSPEDWQAVIDVDLSGVFYGCQAAARRMIDQGDGGQIINTASIMGEVGLQLRAPYCAAKGGVINLTRVLAVEWAPHAIHVNAIAPGYIMTEMVGEAADEAGFDEDDVRARTPLGRFGTLDEMANCARFLAGGDHFITGETINADGGWLAFGWGSRNG